MCGRDKLFMTYFSNHQKKPENVYSQAFKFYSDLIVQNSNHLLEDLNTLKKL